MKFHPIIIKEHYENPYKLYDKTNNLIDIDIQAAK